MAVAAQDMNLDDLLADLSNGEFLSNFDMPEFANGGSSLTEQTILGYGDNFGGVDYKQDDDVFGFYSKSSGPKATMSTAKGLGKAAKDPKKPAEVKNEVKSEFYCEKCCLVPAEVDCPDCKIVMCAFCDFETHTKEADGCKHHGCRVMLCRQDATGKDIKGSQAMQQLWQTRDGLSAPQPAPASKVVATEKVKHQKAPLPSCPPPSTHVRLDEQIMEFFQTDEFANVVSNLTESEVDEFVGLPLDFKDDMAELALTSVTLVGAGKRKAPSQPSPQSRVLCSTPGLKKIKTEAKAAKRAAKAEAAAAAAAEPVQHREGFEFRMKSGPSDLEGEELAAWWRYRTAALERWKAKKLAAKLNPQVRYGSRKKIADSRPRVKGRFIKTVEQVTAASGPAAGQ